MTRRSRKPKPDAPKPELLIRAALGLLALAGVVPERLMTVREVCAAVPWINDPESVRTWCRHGLGRFDRRLGQYLISEAELAAFLARRAAKQKAFEVNTRAPQRSFSLCVGPRNEEP